MIKKRVHFGIGLFVGIILSVIFFQFVASRYIVIESNGMILSKINGQKIHGRMITKNGRKLKTSQ